MGGWEVGWPVEEAWLKGGKQEWLVSGWVGE